MIEPNADIRRIAKDYRKHKGIEYIPPVFREKRDEEIAKQMAWDYERSENDISWKVLKCYKALSKETIDQFLTIHHNGYRIMSCKNDPYRNSKEMTDDIRQNRRVAFLLTDTSDFPSWHPLIDVVEDDSLKYIPHSLVINDIFRAVHDFFGHAEHGFSFDAHGEENAWLNHSTMFSDDARKALTTETRGQNSWVNYNEKVSRENTPIKDRPFAEQKTFLYNDKFVFPERDISLSSYPFNYA